MIKCVRLTHEIIEHGISRRIQGGENIAIGAIFIYSFLCRHWRLFVKCGQPGWAAFVPGYNVVVAMRIIGRPANTRCFSWCQDSTCISSSARSLNLRIRLRSTLDYALACVFNVFYILNLGLSEEEDYEGPVYGMLATVRRSITRKWRWLLEHLSSQHSNEKGQPPGLPFFLDTMAVSPQSSRWPHRWPPADLRHFCLRQWRRTLARHHPLRCEGRALGPNVPHASRVARQRRR